MTGPRTGSMPDGGELLPGWRSVRRLATGATAVVHLARADGATRASAPALAVVKIAVDHDARAALRREAEVLRELEAIEPAADRRWPVVVATAGITSAAANAPAAALVLHPVADETLHDLLARRGAPLPADEVAHVIADVADIVSVLHRQGVCHGDLSAANVGFTAGGAARLLDFGHATRLGSCDDRSASPRVAAGTIPFAAPEVRAGAAVDERAEVYALGMLGVVARHADAGGGLDASGASDRAADRDAARRLAEVLDRATAIDRSQRPPSADALAALLRRACPDHRPPRIEALDHSPATDPRRWRALPAPPTVEFGPRPPARALVAPRAAGRGRTRTLLPLVPAVLGLGLLLAGVLAARRPAAVEVRSARAAMADAGPADPAHPSGAADPAGAGDLAEHPTTAPPAASTAGAAPSATGGFPCVRLVGVGAESGASDCPTLVSWHAERGEATLHTATATTRFALGAPGDVLLVGDWDGDAAVSPSLYRPATGDIYEFDRWATPDDPAPSAVARSTGIREGRASVRREGDRDVIDVAR